MLSPFVIVGVYALLTLTVGRAAQHLLSFGRIGNVYNFANLLFFATSTILLWNFRSRPPIPSHDEPMSTSPRA